MKKIFFLVSLALLLAPAVSFAWGNDVRVNGYTRKDGTYVQPHMRTAPDNTTNNNYSTHGNTNPYTGRQGTQTNNAFPGSFSSGSNSLGGMGSGRQGSNPAIGTW